MKFPSRYVASNSVSRFNLSPPTGIACGSDQSNPLLASQKESRRKVQTSSRSSFPDAVRFVNSSTTLDAAAIAFWERFQAKPRHLGKCNFPNIGLRQGIWYFPGLTHLPVDCPREIGRLPGRTLQQAKSSRRKEPLGPSLQKRSGEDTSTVGKICSRRTLEIPDN